MPEAGEAFMDLEEERRQDRALAATPAVDYLMNHLEAHMAEFNPRLVAKLEKSRELQGFLQGRALHALKTWHQALKQDLSKMQARELAESVLLPVPEDDQGMTEDSTG